MEIVRIDIDKLQPYDNNIKEHPFEQIEQIKRSIEEFGNNDPIAVDENYVIIEGHGRYEALKQLGYTEAECIILNNLTEEQKNAYRIIHNQLTMNTGFDMEKLEQELKSISIDLTEMGLNFDMLTFANDEKEVVEDEFQFSEEPEEPSKVKRGDLFLIGKHRLLCGDATDDKDMETLCDSAVMDLIMTDPPYNVNYGAVNSEEGYGKQLHNSTPIANDNMEKNQFYEFLKKTFANAYMRIKEGGSFYVWYASRSVVEFKRALEDVGFLVKQELIWKKNTFTLGRQDYQWLHEPCHYGWKEGAGHYFINDRSQTTIWDEPIDINKMTKEQLKDMLQQILSETTPTTIFNENKPAVNDLHPTMKPIRLLARMIANSTRENEKVIDMFGGYWC